MSLTPERLAALRDTLHWLLWLKNEPEPMRASRPAHLWHDDYRDMLAEYDRLGAVNERLNSELTKEHEARLAAVATIEELIQERLLRMPPC